MGIEEDVKKNSKGKNQSSKLQIISLKLFY